MVADPVRGADYPATYQQLLRWFPDDRACLEYLGRLRWEDGFCCPECGGDRFWRTGDGLWMCLGVPAAYLGDGGDDLPIPPARRCRRGLRRSGS